MEEHALMLAGVPAISVGGGLHPCVKNQTCRLDSASRSIYIAFKEKGKHDLLVLALFFDIDQI